MYLVPGGVPGLGGVPGPGGVLGVYLGGTWSERGVYLVWGVYLVPGGVPSPGRGMYLVQGGCTWSGGCT